MLHVSMTIESIGGLPPRPVITITDDEGNILNPITNDDAHNALLRYEEEYPHMKKCNYLIKAS